MWNADISKKKIRILFVVINIDSSEKHTRSMIAFLHNVGVFTEPMIHVCDYWGKAEE